MTTALPREDGDDSAVEAKARARKRGNCEGAIDQRPSGAWRGRIMVGYLPNGKADRRTVSGKTRQEVQKKLRDLLRRAETGQLAEREKENDTLEAYLKRWLETIPGTVKASTVVRYRPLVNNHLIPALGKKKLAELRPDAIQALYAERQNAGLSPTTVRLLHTTLHKALEDAVKFGYLASNPAARIRRPRRAEFEARVLSATEVCKLLDAADRCGDRLVGLWRLLADTGAREGELLALTWDHVLWDRSAISIAQSITLDLDRHQTTDTTKTARGRRVVSLDTDALDGVRRHRARQNADKLKLGPDYDDHNLVFATSLGTPLSERNVIRAFKIALKHAGFGEQDRARIRLYDLRHHHITEASHAGVSVKALSSRVGHASVAFTLDRYAHALESADRDVAAAVAERRREAPRKAREGEVDQAPKTGTDQD